MTQCSESHPGAILPTPLLTPKRITKIATWNIRTMFDARKAAQLAKEESRSIKRDEEPRRQSSQASGGSSSKGEYERALQYNEDTDTELRMMGYTWKEVVRTAQVRVRWRAVVNGLCSTWRDGSK